MSVLKIVQSVNTLAVTGTAATTNGITLQSGILRVSAASTGCHIQIGVSPIATTSAASDNSILINFNSASITGIGITNSTVARSVKISSIAAGTATNLHISEVQIVGG
jgi:hypothetical protein